MFRSAIRTPLATANAAARTFSTSAVRPYARVNLIGNLGNDPELVATSTGRELIRYTLAVQNGRGDNAKTSWFRVSSFADGPQREFLLNLSKGSKVFVEGDISTRQYEDAEGRKTTTVNITQRQLEVLRRKQQPSEAEGASQSA
ncbi:hypothetical protein KEM56_007188 [Ascosphaera pollenicola]|nr:hypothetical protein KEM56_007188 [Ascosphaera pollenicola]